MSEARQRRQESLRERLGDGRGERLGKALYRPARKPAPDGGDRPCVRRAGAEGVAGAGGRHGRAQHPLCRRHRTPDPPPALGVTSILEGIEDGVDRLDRALDAERGRGAPDRRSRRSCAERSPTTARGDRRGVPARARSCGAARGSARPPGPKPRDAKRARRARPPRRGRSRPPAKRPAAERCLIRRSPPARPPRAHAHRARRPRDSSSSPIRVRVPSSRRRCPRRSARRRRGSPFEPPKREQRGRLHLDGERIVRRRDGWRRRS